jgi:type III pantothenate kinase
MSDQTVLACDVGNTRIALGGVTAGKAAHVQRLDASEAAAVGDVLVEIWEKTPGIKAVAASSVNATLLRALETATQERLGQKVLLVGRDIPLPMPTNLAEPQKIGTDRLCSAAMAYYRMESACVVASLGTAITVDCVDEQGVFQGGAILPGLRIGVDALAERTAQLPRVTLRTPDWVFGRNTEEAIIGGLVYGARGALRELTEAYATALGKWPPLILTGGDAQLVGAGYDLVHAVVPDLCLLGVALAYDIFHAAQPPTTE